MPGAMQEFDEAIKVGKIAGVVDTTHALIQRGLLLYKLKKGTVSLYYYFCCTHPRRLAGTIIPTC